MVLLMLRLQSSSNTHVGSGRVESNDTEGTLRLVQYELEDLAYRDTRVDIDCAHLIG